LPGAFSFPSSSPRPQFLELQRVVLDLCARHLLSGEKCAYVLGAFEQERAEKEKRDGEIARLKAAARTADSDRRDLQLRYDAALVATASREEKAELLRLRSAFYRLEERAQRLEAANRQLERLAQDNDIAVPDSVEMFRPLVSEWATRAVGRAEGRVGVTTSASAAVDFALITSPCFPCDDCGSPNACRRSRSH
jgi:hypothetical protein